MAYSNERREDSNNTSGGFSLKQIIGVLFVLGIGMILGKVFFAEEIEVPAVINEGTQAAELLSTYLEDMNVVLYAGVTVSYYTPAQGGYRDVFSASLIPEYSCAVNPQVIPYGATVIYNGQGYRATDTGTFTDVPFDELIIGICSLKNRGMTFNNDILVIYPKE